MYIFEDDLTSDFKQVCVNYQRFSLQFFAAKITSKFAKETPLKNSKNTARMATNDQGKKTLRNFAVRLKLNEMQSTSFVRDLGPVAG